MRLAPRVDRELERGRQEELVLAAEVPVDGPGGVAGLASDLLERGPVETVLGEGLDRRRDQLRPRLLLALLAAGPALAVRCQPRCVGRLCDITVLCQLRPLGEPASFSATALGSAVALGPT